MLPSHSIRPFLTVMILTCALGQIACSQSVAVSAEPDMSVKLAAINGAQDAFRQLEPNWVRTKNCDTGSSDFYECMAFVGIRGTEEQMRQSGLTNKLPDTPKLMNNINVNVLEISLV